MSDKWLTEGCPAKMEVPIDGEIWHVVRFRHLGVIGPGKVAYEVVVESRLQTARLMRMVLAMEPMRK